MGDPLRAILCDASSPLCPTCRDALQVERMADPCDKCGHSKPLPLQVGTCTGCGESSLLTFAEGGMVLVLPVDREEAAALRSSDDIKASMRELGMIVGRK